MRLSDVKEVGEAPPGGILLGFSIFQHSGESWLHAQLTHKLLSRQPAESEETSFCFLFPQLCSPSLTCTTFLQASFCLHCPSI
ncbi:hypothetical protein PBY51_011635 [Eleginops maclovinus]|uniref:Uncharacterized protein n=1 Tax=Eleginops maclovinus TaxID=56733 RepID=A0AAN8ALI8_ELEMC|nr:hypothetical protein PBY51_011635 [Eleginops maclovinus]